MEIDLEMKKMGKDEENDENEEEKKRLSGLMYKEKVTGLVKLAEKTGCAQILAEIMQIDLMNLSVPRQLRNMNFKDVKPEKVYDVDQVALICKTEKLPFLHQIVTSESKE